MDEEYLQDRDEYGPKHRTAVKESYRWADNSFSKLKRISSEETEDLIVRMREAERTGRYNLSIKLRNKVIEGNFGLVLKFAGWYAVRYRKDISDLISVGGVGMMHAIEKHDSKKGKFGTYAPYWIKQTIRGFLYLDNLVSKPVYHTEKYSKIRKIQRELEREGRDSMIEDIAKLAGYSIGIVKNVLEACRKYKKIVTLVEGFHDKSDENAEVQVKRTLSNEQRELLQEAIDKNLSFIERQVVTYRYGLDEKHGVQTLEQLGSIFHKTRERIRQIEEKAIRKLQSPGARRVLESLVA